MDNRSVSQDTKNRNGGRPSAATTAKRREILKPYYNRGLAPATVYEMAGPILEKQGLPNMTREGIRRQFQIWAEQEAEQYSKDLLEREEEVRARAVRAMDSQLYILQNAQAELENTAQTMRLKAQQAGEPFVLTGTLANERRQYATTILNAIAMKVEVETAPTLSDKLKEQIDEFVERKT